MKPWAVTLGRCGLVTALAVGMTWVAEAQPPEGRPGPRRHRARHCELGGGGLWGLLQTEAVQRELGLREEQLRRIEAIRAELRSPDEERHDPTSGAESRQQRVKRLLGEIETMLDAVQLKRLEQISLQARLKLQGVMALDDPRVAEALALEDAQKEQLHQLRERLRQQRREELPRPDPDAWLAMTPQQQQEHREQVWKLIETLHAEEVQQAMEILTPEQVQKLEQLKGKPFTFDIRAPKTRSKP